MIRKLLFAVLSLCILGEVCCGSAEGNKTGEVTLPSTSIPAERENGHDSFMDSRSSVNATDVSGALRNSTSTVGSSRKAKSGLAEKKSYETYSFSDAPKEHDIPSAERKSTEGKSVYYYYYPATMTDNLNGKSVSNKDSHADEDQPIPSYSDPQSGSGYQISQSPDPGYGYPAPPPDSPSPQYGYSQQDTSSGYAPAPQPPAPQYGYPDADTPAPSPQSGYGYPAPAPQSGYGYPAPAPPAPVPQQGYGYSARPSPAPPAQYGYPAPDTTTQAPQSGYGYPAPSPPVTSQGYGYQSPPAPALQVDTGYQIPPQPPAPQQGYGYMSVPQPDGGYRTLSPAPQKGYGYPAPSPPAPAYGAPPPPPAQGYASPPSTDYGYGQGAGNLPAITTDGVGGGNFGQIVGEGGQGGGEIGQGPAGPPPPPPPAPVKGSIDYVLIPLILIGITAPIFVVVYVVLGSFEAKLAPVLLKRSLSSISSYASSLKPTTDALMSSVSRALDSQQCWERMACEAGTFCQRHGMSDSGWLDKTLDPFVPKTYQRQYRTFMSAMHNSKEYCTVFKCL